jgi:hypothetical protein
MPFFGLYKIGHQEELWNTGYNTCSTFSAFPRRDESFESIIKGRNPHPQERDGDGDSEGTQFHYTKSSACIKPVEAFMSSPAQR